MKSCRNAGMEMPRCQILPGPSGLGRGGHAAGTAGGELCCLRDRGAAGLWQTTPYLCPRQISLPGQSGGTVPG